MDGLLGRATVDWILGSAGIHRFEVAGIAAIRANPFNLRIVRTQRTESIKPIAQERADSMTAGTTLPVIFSHGCMLHRHHETTLYRFWEHPSMLR